MVRLHNGQLTIARIERLQAATAVALVKGDNSLAIAQARFDQLKRVDCDFRILSGQPLTEKEIDEMPIPAWEPPCPKERDEYSAMHEAARDLDRLPPLRAPSMVTSKTGNARIHRHQIVIKMT